MSLLAIYLVVYLDFFQMSFVFPFFAALVESFGGDESTVSQRCALLSAVLSGVEAVTMPMFGALSDRYGRRVAMMTSILGNGAAQMQLGFCTSFPQVVAARIVNGMFAGAPCSHAEQGQPSRCRTEPPGAPLRHPNIHRPALDGACVGMLCESRCRVSLSTCVAGASVAPPT